MLFSADLLDVARQLRAAPRRTRRSSPCRETDQVCGLASTRRAGIEEVLQSWRGPTESLPTNPDFRRGAGLGHPCAVVDRAIGLPLRRPTEAHAYRAASIRQVIREIML